jgi:flagellar biosynthesis/type III secretory pathway chaperone
MTNHLTHLLELLSREREETDAFVAILEQEAQILAAGADPQALADVTQSKWYRAHALNALCMERQALLGTMGPAVNMEALSAKHTEIAEIWRKLKPALEYARVLNASNGVVIEELRKSTEEAMASLSSASGQVTVYTATGQPSSMSRRMLATG